MCETQAPFPQEEETKKRDQRVAVDDQQAGGVKKKALKTLAGAELLVETGCGRWIARTPWFWATASLLLRWT